MALLQFLRSNDVSHRLFVADSSEPDQADALRNALDGSVDLRCFSGDMRVVEKYLAALAIWWRPSSSASFRTTTSPFPHAIDACLAYLQSNQDSWRRWATSSISVFTTASSTIRRVRYFTPTMGADEPLQRLYDLVRRYQPFLWAVFRTEALVAALEASLKMDIIVFQELTIMNAAAAQGKIARLPHIFSLCGMEELLSAAVQTHPMYAFLYEAERLFSSYLLYRNNLVAFLQTHMDAATWDRAVRKIEAALAEGVVEGLPGTGEGTVEQLLDIIHMINMVPSLDTGQLNYAAQRLLGASHPPIPISPQWSGPMDRREGDVLRGSRVPAGAICGAARFSRRSHGTKFISIKPRSLAWKRSLSAIPRADHLVGSILSPACFDRMKSMTATGIDGRNLLLAVKHRRTAAGPTLYSRELPSPGTASADRHRAQQPGPPRRGAGHGMAQHPHSFESLSYRVRGNSSAHPQLARRCSGAERQKDTLHGRYPERGPIGQMGLAFIDWDRSVWGS